MNEKGFEVRLLKPSEAPRLFDFLGNRLKLNSKLKHLGVNLGEYLNKQREGEWRKLAEEERLFCAVKKSEIIGLGAFGPVQDALDRTRDSTERKQVILALKELGLNPSKVAAFHDLYTTPAERKQGIATALIEERLRKATESGKYSHGVVKYLANSQSHGLWRKQGAVKLCQAGEHEYGVVKL